MITDESRRKMSVAKLGKKFSEDHKRKISESTKGKKRSEDFRKKMSLMKKGKVSTFKGKHHSEESRRKMSDSKKGDKTHFWKGGIYPKHLAIRKSLEYRLWREAVFKRDNWTCVWCGVRSVKDVAVILNADHIKSFAFYPELRFAIDNGRTLCVPCHKTTDTFKRKTPI